MNFTVLEVFLENATTAVLCPKTPQIPMSPLRRNIGQYVFPCLFVIGVIGNLLNLLVLNSRGMRTKTNALLSAMALADLGFLFVMLCGQLQAFQKVANNDGYRYFLAKNKTILTMLSNWLSTASTWLALAVTAERVIAIKMPLHAKFYWKHKRVACAIVLVFTVAFLLHLYNVFWFVFGAKTAYCTDGTVAYTLYYLTELSRNDSAYAYVKSSSIVAPLVSVVVPFFVLANSNAILLYYLHKNRRAMAGATNATQMKANEMRVATMVAFIVVTFIVCLTPSVAVYFYHTVCEFVLKRSPYTPAFFTATAISNCLVVMGKASNFVLYCSASSHFRKRLFRMLCASGDAAQSRASSQRRLTFSTLFTSPSATVDQNLHQQQQHKPNALPRRHRSNSCQVEARDAASRGRNARASLEQLIELKSAEPLKNNPSVHENSPDVFPRSLRQLRNQRHENCPINDESCLLAETRRFSSPDH